jgi:peptidyl-prolyl cis-trans isomerase B (cyclophilin B)
MTRRLAPSVICACLAIAGCGGEDAGIGDLGITATVSDSDAGCSRVAQPAPKRVQFRKPEAVLKPGQKAIARVKTNCGSFEIALDTKRAPKTANSFAFLAGKGFYDGLLFHRIEPGFVIQGGDPRGDGSGGPGYSVDEPPPPDLAYTGGVVAMAKTEAEPPGRSGSQFFVVTAADAGLDPAYALLGRVTAGEPVVDEIEMTGGPTVQPVVIERITIRRP